MISLYTEQVDDNPGDVVVAKVGGELIEMPLNEGDAPAASSPAENPGSTSAATGAATNGSGNEAQPETKTLPG